MEDIPYRCTFCGMLFCGKHRLPENHECPFDLRRSSELEDSINRSLVIYQDALDYLDRDLTVTKIYEFVTTRQMNNLEATELLTHFLETSIDIEMRINSIMAFKVLGLKNDSIFNALEDCILSDEDINVKKTAINVIRDIFPKKSIHILNWFYDHNKNSKK